MLFLLVASFGIDLVASLALGQCGDGVVGAVFGVETVLDHVNTRVISCSNKPIARGTPLKSVNNIVLQLVFSEDSGGFDIEDD